jgi:hypothetical protein
MKMHELLYDYTKQAKKSILTGKSIFLRPT